MCRSTQSDLALCQRIISECADYLSANRKSVQHREKISSNGSPEVVTNLDVELNRLVIRLIHEEAPGDIVVGEEIGYGLPSDRYWVIDPIDGTRSFLASRPGAAIVLALVIDNEPIISVIHDIAASKTTSIYDGRLSEDGLDLTFPASVAQNLAWNPYLKEYTLQDAIMQALDLSGVIEIESTALRAVEIAKGRARVLISLPGSSKLWDSVTAIHIFSSMSGRYTDLDGNRITLHPTAPVNTRGAAGSRGVPHARLLKTVASWM